MISILSCPTLSAIATAENPSSIRSDTCECRKCRALHLRHSHASLLISLGENAIIIMNRLGHEDVETTLGTYGHLYPNTNKEVATKLSNLIKFEQCIPVLAKKD